MTPGSSEWLELRETNARRWCCGDRDAQRFLEALGVFVEWWDDLIDRDNDEDALDPLRIRQACSMVLLDVGMNPFVARHQGYLYPLLVQMIAAYEQSEMLKRHPSQAVRERAFHLRNYPLELYQAAAFLTGGWSHLMEIGSEIREFFAFERFDEWEHADG